MRIILSDFELKWTNFVLRTVGLITILTSAWYLLWVAQSLNWSQPLVSVSFLAATILTVGFTFIEVINAWSFVQPGLSRVKRGFEPKVAVLIPTYKEPVDMVIRTISSVFEQDWPSKRLIAIVGDDSNNIELKKAIRDYKKNNPDFQIIYHLPPTKGSPERNGEGKAGNLNSCLDVIRSRFPRIEFIETRDADDLVPNRSFLRNTIAHLQKYPDLSFVQTIKRSKVSKDDPFSNQEKVFYSRIMPSKAADNAVFPCGSGLVWRNDELKKIGNFPTWNLVEDLQSGYEILNKNGKGAYLPIVGALGQVAPEDIPNFYKQRGTWALDTLRLFFWKNPLFSKNLNLMQKLHFLELQMSYLLSFGMAIFMVNIFLALWFSLYPMVGSPISYLIHMGIFALAVECFSWAKSRGLSFSDRWRTKQIWLGLMFVFMIAAFKALRYGPKNKPAYVVTRKTQKTGIYLTETAPQLISILILMGAIFKVSLNHGLNLLSAIAVLWALYYVAILSRTIRNSWYGMDMLKVINPEININRIFGKILSPIFN